MTTPSTASTRESKLWRGVLTIGGTDYGCQTSNVTITPGHSASGDVLYLLCGNALTPDEKRTDTLKITAVQDFDNPDGFVAMSWAEDGNVVEFTWTPNEVTGSVSYSGAVKVRALEVGGDVRSRLTTSAEWPIEGAVEPTYAAGGGGA